MGWALVNNNRPVWEWYHFHFLLIDWLIVLTHKFAAKIKFIVCTKFCAVFHVCISYIYIYMCSVRVECIISDEWVQYAAFCYFFVDVVVELMVVVVMVMVVLPLPLLHFFGHSGNMVVFIFRCIHEKRYFHTNALRIHVYYRT